jgi:hypothetical protein
MTLTRYREKVSPGPGTAVQVVGVKQDTNLKSGAVSNRVNVTAQLSTTPSTFTEKECTWDENHGRPPYQVGGSFFKKKITNPSSLQGSGTYFVGNFGSGNSLVRREYIGSFLEPTLLVFSGGDTFLNFNSSLEGVSPIVPHSRWNPDDISELGDKAFTVLRPKVAVGGVAQAVYELKDAPGMLRQSAQGFLTSYKALGGSMSGSQMSFLRKFGFKADRGFGIDPLIPLAKQSVIGGRAASDHFLNHTFGWVPFVKDVTQTCDMVLFYDHYRKRAIRRNGLWQKRVFFEPISLDESVLYDANEWQVDPVPFVTTEAGFKKRYRVLKRTFSRVWYEGSFRTYDPEFDYEVEMHPGVRQVRQALTLSGSWISPSLLWKVTPWTWMVDWFSNTGELIQRAQNAITESNVSRYLYVMRTIEVEYLYQQSFTTKDGVEHKLEWTLGGVTKLRAKGESPFEFHLRVGGLTATQHAILAALGISRLRP